MLHFRVVRMFRGFMHAAYSTQSCKPVSNANSRFAIFNPPFSTFVPFPAICQLPSSTCYAHALAAHTHKWVDKNGDMRLAKGLV
jgi:hypothetical protein